MHQEVYIDIVFAANLLMDYILLRLTGIVLRRKNSRRRCLAAAAVGALFACLNLYSDVCSSDLTDHSSSSSLCCVHDMDRI